MSSVVVCGGSAIGLSVAMMLASDGHGVTVLEADPHEPPATPTRAWDCWMRNGVAQFRQPHNLFARFRQVCEAELPGMVERLLAAGCVRVDHLDSLPPTVSDHSPRPGDEARRFVTGRRPVVEAVFAHAAGDQPGVRVRRGHRVAGLIAGRDAIPGVPHVVGVRTEGGERIPADLVIDATGRRSPCVRWLTALGARSPYRESVDRGFVYYTRYFTGPRRPRRIGRPLVPVGSFSVLTLDGDNDTWSITLFGTTADAPLKQLRDPATFNRVVAACPLHRHWLDGRPITGVLAMAGVLDRYHRFVVDGQPVVTGFASVGDAWACTNPSAGRGLSVGIVHAQLLRQLTRAHLHDPATFARAFDEHTGRVVAPFYRNQATADRARIAEMDALRTGQPVPRPANLMTRLATAASYDPDVFRAMLDTLLCLALPEEVLTRPGIQDKIDSYAHAEPPPTPGPDRARLLDLLADRRSPRHVELAG